MFANTKKPEDMADGENNPTTPAAPAKSAWDTRVGAFAEAVSKDLDNVTSLLKGVAGEPSEAALEVLADVDAVPDVLLIERLAPLDIPLGVLRKNLKKLRGTPVIKQDDASTASTGSVMSVLPVVPDDESFLKALQVGGDLKVEETEVLSAVKAGLADRVHLFQVSEKISEKMEEFSTAQGEPVGKDFFRVQSMLAERKYGEVLTALDIKGKFMSEARKKDFLGRINTTLWPTLAGFHDQLKGFYDNWVSTSANPHTMMLALSGSLPKGLMMEMPDSGPIRSSADRVIEDINKVFAGVGVPVIRALAYDATRIMGILKEPTLPAQLGLTTRDQMLKTLGVNVGSDVVRFEQALTRYTLSIMKLQQVTAESEIMYLMAMMQLGNTIPWDSLVSGRAGIGNGMAGVGKGRL